MSKYSKAHEHINSVKGRAADKLCSCGVPAWGWGFTYLCLSPSTDDKGRPFCRHPEHYQAMCRSCHLKHDLQADERTRKLSLTGSRKGGLAVAATSERMAEVRAGQPLTKGTQ